jgi:FkbM family methyltransferase
VATPHGKNGWNMNQPQPTLYNPYTPDVLPAWHEELSMHVGWHVRHVCDYFLERGYTSIKMLDVGCNTGRMIELMNQRLPISDAILVDVIPELIEYARNIFGEQYKYESCALGNHDGVTNLTLPLPHEHGINLGGATASKVGGNDRIDVPIHKFDTLWKEKYIGFEPDLIKIDAEGLDIDVLEGMKEFISSLSRKPLVVYEIAGLNMSEEQVANVYSRLQFLTDMGYEPLFENSLAPKKSIDLVITVEV